MNLSVFRLTACLLFTLLLATAQAPRTAEEVAGYIRIAIQKKYKDGEVAATLESVRLSNRLDAKIVTELQRLGAGPKTVQALTRLSAISAALPAAGPVTAKAGSESPPAPTQAEQAQIITDVRRNALSYTQNLPNYLCRQVTKRRVDSSGSGSWRTVDVILEQLSFFDTKESYKVVMVNSTPVTNNLRHEDLGGAVSSGEFGSILRSVFQAETETAFDFERWTGLHGRWQLVFSFRTGQPVYGITHGGSGRSIVTRVEGQVFIDRDTHHVSRIRFECRGIPGDFPIENVMVSQDYDFVDIGESKYMLPLHAEVRSREGKAESWNEVTFGGYRKFAADATISFDTSDLPADRLKEDKPKK